MNFIYLIQILCYLAGTNSYVLLAANMDDFRTLAKKFVPQNLADQLLEMVSKTSSQKDNIAKTQPNADIYYDDSTHESQASDDSYEIINDDVKTNPQKEKDEKFVKKSYIPSRISKDSMIDDIVEKVKERLERDYRLSPAVTESDNKKTVQYEKESREIDYDSPKTPNSATDKDYDYKNTENFKQAKDQDYKQADDDTEVIYSTKYAKTTDYDVTQSRYTKRKQAVKKVTRNPNSDRKRTSKEHDTTRYTPKIKEIEYLYDDGDNYDENPVNKPTEKAGHLFEAVDMANANDSYEDYVTPKKYEVFESKEIKLPKRFNVKAKTQKAAKVFTDDKPALNGGNDYDYDVTPAEIKARTVNMRFDDKDIFMEAEKKGVTVKSDGRNATKKSKAGTMIPTREYYKMSSPNYVAKLPNIAEKYDFDEPLPERDREPEDLRPIANPPASINKKVKLN